MKSPLLFLLISGLCMYSTATISTDCQSKYDYCMSEGATCTLNATGCCDGLGCFGYGFYKRCKLPPACLDEWHDCSSGMKCCEPMVCAISASGARECKNRTVDTKTDDTPTPAPTPPNTINTNTTTVPGKPVISNVACVVGDPHIYTFDGLTNDCQAEGEFILAKSKFTRREIQGRFRYFDRFATGNAWSVAKAVVVQDEGLTPKVQLNIRELDTSLASNVITSMACPVQFFVDGVQRDLDTGSGSDKVIVTHSGDNIDINYVASKLHVSVSFGWANGCFLNVCVYLPDTDHTIGLLGTADGNVWDDWTTRDGEQLVVPESLTDRMTKAGYDYCTQHWCISNPEDSLFTYAELGIGFDYYNHCMLPYGNSLEQFFLTVNKTILDTCGRELMCIIDAQMGGIDTAVNTKAARAAVSKTCNGAGGECNVASCCTGLLCVEKTGFGKECALTEPQCVGEWAECSNRKCCGDLICETLNGGYSQCRDFPDCMPEWQSCSQVPCCEGSTCVEKDGLKTCRVLPKCMPEWQDCSMGIGCCDGLTCVTDPSSGWKSCINVPTCAAEWVDCSTMGCCNGLTCVTESDGRKMCEKLPSCVAEWQSCDYIGCCQDGPYALKCFDFVDSSGRHAKQCQAACSNSWGQCDAERPCCDPKIPCVNGQCTPTY